jgi:hypothetical protein
MKTRVNNNPHSCKIVFSDFDASRQVSNPVRTTCHNFDFTTITFCRRDRFSFLLFFLLLLICLVSSLKVRFSLFFCSAQSRFFFLSVILLSFFRMSIATRLDVRPAQSHILSIANAHPNLYFFPFVLML